MTFIATHKDGVTTRRLRISRVIVIGGLNFVLHRSWEGDGWAVSDLLSGAEFGYGSTQAIALWNAEMAANHQDWRRAVKAARGKVARFKAKARARSGA